MRTLVSAITWLLTETCPSSSTSTSAPHVTSSASPVVPNLNIAGEHRNVLFVATMGSTVYAFNADDPARVEPYWSKNLGTPAAGDSWIGPVYHGILSTPFIDVATGTLYTVTMVRKDQKSNLFVHALDIHDGKPKYNSPQLLSFPFAGAETLTNVKGALQRVGLLMRNEVLYIAFANIVPDPKDQHWSQEGFVQSFNRPRSQPASGGVSKYAYRTQGRHLAGRPGHCERRRRQRVYRHRGRHL
jgi:hypothetical protein